MAPKNNSTKKILKKLDHSSTWYLRDEAIVDESSGFIKEYPISEFLEPSPSLLRGTNATHLGQHIP